MKVPDYRLDYEFSNEQSIWEYKRCKILPNQTKRSENWKPLDVKQEELNGAEKHNAKVKQIPSISQVSNKSKG